ncbi:hypothetical protein BKA56DRAFT_625734 [Ilyonectria sp. MPI-CAGE-AT-0026]|nr:hypothetical protein BKA56DRAFT_625734 [Ilyonectria sp. MPI-CAGE-AT-0026]
MAETNYFPEVCSAINDLKVNHEACIAIAQHTEVPIFHGPVRRVYELVFQYLGSKMSQHQVQKWSVAIQDWTLNVLGNRYDKAFAETSNAVCQFCSTIKHLQMMCTGLESRLDGLLSAILGCEYQTEQRYHIADFGSQQHTIFACFLRTVIFPDGLIGPTADPAISGLITIPALRHLLYSNSSIKYGPSGRQLDRNQALPSSPSCLNQSILLIVRRPDPSHLKLLNGLMRLLKMGSPNRTGHVYSRNGRLEIRCHLAVVRAAVRYHTTYGRPHCVTNGGFWRRTSRSTTAVERRGGG